MEVHASLILEKNERWSVHIMKTNKKFVYIVDGGNSLEEKQSITIQVWDSS